MEAEKHSLQLPDGLKISWREFGTGKPLIMLHGWSMSAAVFSEVAIPLSQNYRVLCPDLPGHGDSDPSTECSLAAFAETITAWADQLHLGPTALLGWSLGGQVAQQLASEQQMEITQLLLVATTPRFCQSDDWPHGLPTTQLRALERNLGRAYEKTLGDFFRMQFTADEISKQRFREILQFAVRPVSLPPAPETLKSLAILGREDLRNRLTGIDLPCLVQHGQTDQIIPAAAGTYLAEQIPGAQLALLSGVGHAPFFSRPREAVAQWLDFLV